MVIAVKINVNIVLLGLIKKQKVKMQTSLEQFKWVVETQYPKVKKYITSESESRIILEDPMGDSVFGSNKDLEPLFQKPSPFSFENISVSHKEKDSCFIINIKLK